MIDSLAGKTFSAVDSVNTMPSIERSAPQFSSAEAQLEAEIQAAFQRLCTVPHRHEKLAAWREMVRLIDQRTPERRRFMARVRGLA